MLNEEDAKERATNISTSTLHVFDNLVIALMEFGEAYGSEKTVLSQNDIDSLNCGKALAFSDGEYHHFIVKANTDD